MTRNEKILVIIFKEISSKHKQAIIGIVHTEFVIITSQKYLHCCNIRMLTELLNRNVHGLGSSKNKEDNGT